MANPTREFMFRNVKYGKEETVWDLEPLLYFGASSARADEVNASIEAGAFGPKLSNRIPLVKEFYDLLDAKIESGHSKSTVKKGILNLRRLYTWGELHGVEVSFANLETSFIAWTDSLLHRSRIERSIKSTTAFDMAVSISSLIDSMLERNSKIISKTRLQKSKRENQYNNNSDKNQIATAVSLGHFLVDITTALTKDKIYGPLPIQIETRAGHTLVEWSKLLPPDRLTLYKTGRKPNRRMRQLWTEEHSWRTRHPLFNLRIEAEFLIFIAQTGMNLAQANQLTVGKFTYQSYEEGYKVRRIYKNRRQGEVEFTVYSEYRIHFETYLKWRSAILEGLDDERLFPLTTPGRRRAPDASPHFASIRKRSQLAGVTYVGPRDLRKTRANWLFRKLADTSVTAEMNQHEDRTLLQNYIRPNHQIAAFEVSRFMEASDPTRKAAAPGLCVSASPLATKTAQSTSPSPDCVSPAGCLFCVHHRDVNTLDHFWSLASYRYCKSVELSRAGNSAFKDHPAEQVILAIDARLLSASHSDDLARVNITEAKLKVAEADYHPEWSDLINLLEGQYE